VHPRTKTPVNAVWFNSVIGTIVLLLIFAGGVAIDAIFSIGALAAFFAFTTPIFIRVFFVGNRFRAGPWNLGRLSIPIGAIASVFVLLMIPIICLPWVRGDELTPADFNWTCLVWGGPMLLVCIWWIVDARKWFKGPKVNLDHLMHGREEQAADLQAHDGANVIEGKDADRSSSSDVPGAMPRGMQGGDVKPAGL